MNDLPATDIPVLFLIYNRPHLTTRVFEKIREAKPHFLFLAADGPRHDNATDIESCSAARNAVLNKIDWPCEVKTLLRTENLGCGIAVSQAITWFYEHVDKGIILEDDTLPDITFFQFCSELLNKYSSDARIMHIGGSNFQLGKKWGTGDYYFSQYANIWGWATWKRAWENYRFNLEIRDINIPESSFKTAKERKYWINLFYSALSGEIDTWDYQWHYSLIANSGLAITSNINLIRNIGIGRAHNPTHTKSFSDKYENVSVGSLSFPIKHPYDNRIFKEADHRYFKVHCISKISLKNRLRNLAYKYISPRNYLILKKVFGRY